jgi:hypothetical protein
MLRAVQYEHLGRKESQRTFRALQAAQAWWYPALEPVFSLVFRRFAPLWLGAGGDEPNPTSGAIGDAL